MPARKVSIQELPAKIKKMANIHQTPGAVDYYECKNKEDLFELASRHPFETTVVANNSNTTKTVEGWYMVGLALPIKDDNFKRPVLAFTYLTEAEKRLYSQDIRNEVDRRKKLYNETKAGWKNLIRPS